MSIRKTLAQLPDGVYITATGTVFKIEDEQVTKLVEKKHQDNPTTSLVGGHDDPKRGSN